MTRESPDGPRWQGYEPAARGGAAGRRWRRKSVQCVLHLARRAGGRSAQGSWVGSLLVFFFYLFIERKLTRDHFQHARLGLYFLFLPD